MPSFGSRLAGRTCLIIGGAGGIGVASARRFLREGARVAVSDLPDKLDSPALSELETIGPIARFAADARVAGRTDAMFQAALTFLGGRLDVLFHVAGISGGKLGDGPLHDCSEAGWDQVLEADAKSVFLSNRAATRLMRKQPLDEFGIRGAILNVGSILAASPSPRYFSTYAYAASKGAVRSMTIAAASYYAPERIRFNLLEPGLIDTPMASRAMGDSEILEYLVKKQPTVAGPGSAEDVADAALFLCEPSARFLTGVILPVDGGWRVSEGRAP